MESILQTLAGLDQTYVRVFLAIMRFIAPLLAMILLTIQALSGGFWDNVMGILPQMFYMPMLYFSYCFFDWMGLYGTYFVCFLLMVLVSFLGCRRAEK